MKKCLIVCWMGKLPNYFKLWEKSCEINSDYDFFVFTNQRYESNIKNVKIINLTLDDIEHLIEEKLGFKLKIKKPYKLCDFKPVYGVIFEDYIKNYDFWGHCDIDMIFGKINNFVTDSILKKYDKINELGHFTLYRNTKKINEIYKMQGGLFPYTVVFSNNENYAFDEYTGIMKICKENNIKEHVINEFVDVDVKHSRFLDINGKNYDNQFYIWENGILKQCYLFENNICYIEKMYLHFQKKKPIIDINNYNRYIISSEGIHNYDQITRETFKKYNLYHGIFFEKMEILKYFFKKIIEFFKCSFAQKKIWVKQKINKGV